MKWLGTLLLSILLSAHAFANPIKGAPSSKAISRHYDVLNDPGSRVSDEFAVDSKLQPRVQFWFDVYTRYSANEHIIHHAKYPWIVFDVVDTTPLLLEPIHKWTRYHKGKNLVRTKISGVRSALVRLSKRNSYKNLPALEQELFQLLAHVPGKRKKVFKEASQNVRMQLGQRDFYISGLKNSSPYMPYMEEEMAQAGLPTELARIPLVESSFNEEAESRVGAVGVWQIMPHVGREYLIVNEHIDERLSPIKATYVARELMRRNYRVLKSWPLAVTAYNHGASSLKKYLSATQSKTLDDMIRNSPHGAFRFASANFYSCFLAALYADKYRQEIFGDTLTSPGSELKYQVLVLNKKTRLKQLIASTKSDKESLLDLNPDLEPAYKKNVLLPTGFRVLLPL